MLKPVPLMLTWLVILVVCLLRILSLPELFPKFDFIQRLEWDTYDWRMRNLFQKQAPTATNLATVFIDDESLKWINESQGFSWPLPRQVYGKVIRELMAQGAKMVAFDILFAEEHPDLENTRVSLKNGEKVRSDEFFARQIAAASNKVALAVMGQSLYDQADPGKLIWEPFLPHPRFAAGAQLGHIVSESDSDAVLRRVLAYRDDGTTNQTGRYWFMGLVLAAQELGLDLARTKVEKDRLILNGPSGVQRVIPADQNGTFLINWSLDWNDKRMVRKGLDEVLLMDFARQSGEPIKEDVFKDKLVVVGSLGTGSNLSDRGATSLSKLTFLVSKHWNVANSIITNRFIKTCPLWLELLLIVAMGCLGALLTWEITRPWAASLCVLGGALLYVLAANWLFAGALFWLPIVTPAAGALVLSHVAAITYRVVFEQQEKRRIRNVFAKVVSPDVVTELLQAENLSLGGAQRRVTVYFADVRGFTELTDSAHQRAQEHVQRLQLTGRAAEEYLDEQARDLLATVNLYLSTVANTIMDHGGTLDKYIGDCVMAFWGAPTANEKHALSCVRAAIAAQRNIHKLNLERQQENQRREAENAKRAAANLPQLPLLSLLFLGSGINTGTVTVGLMGSEEHLINYTVFGRDVNLASRLESVSGRGRIIIGEATFQDLQRDDPALAASCIAQPPIMVKGIRTAVQVYEVPWKPPEKPAPPSPSSSPAPTPP
mgnify:CR=1 FL=1